MSLASLLMGVAGLEARERHSLLPPSTSNRIEGAFVVPARGNLELQWEARDEGEVGIWLHSEAETRTWKFPASAGAVRIDLHRWTGRRVLIRARERGFHPRTMSWVAASVDGDDLAALAEPPSGAPDLLLYVIDALRPSSLGAYGGWGPTPHLDRLARRGALAPRVVSTTSWTRPAVASLFSGLSVTGHGVRRETGLPERAVTLAERLTLRGYRCHAIYANHHIDRIWGFDQGFRSFVAPPPPDPKRGGLRHNHSGEVRARLRQLLEVDSGPGPRFFYIHVVDPHAPYETPEWLLPESRPEVNLRDIRRRVGTISPSLLEQIRLRYRGAVAYADHEFARVRLLLGQRTDLDELVVAVTSDHGEAFLEHGQLGHGKTTYQEEIRIPLILQGAGLAGTLAARRWYSLADVPPTLLSLVGITASGTRHGADVRSASPGFVVSELLDLPRPRRAILHGDWKMIRIEGRGRQELFHLGADPLELDGRRLQSGPWEELAQKLQRWQDAMAQSRVDDEAGDLPEPGPDVIENLRALGYID